LTGFAVQVTPTLRDRFDVVYEGWFFEAGDPVERRNGEPCFSPLANDPLGAIRIRLLERRLQPRPAGEPAPTPSSPPPATPLAAEAAASPRPAPAKRVRAAGVRKPKPAAGRR
jgi:hypothetical protein